MADQQTPFDPDAYLAARAQGLAPTPVDPLQVQQFDPDEYLRKKRILASKAAEEQSGGLPNEILNTAENAASGFSLGTSDLLEQQLAKVLPEGVGQYFTAEAVKKRREQNPLTTLAGQALGTGGLLALTGGAAAPVEAAAAGAGLGPLAARAAGMGLEGAIVGGGNVVSDYALGDPNLNAQKIMTTIGMGGLLGAGLAGISRGIEALPALFRKGIGAAGRESEGVAAPVLDVPTGKPKSLEQMDAMLDQAKKYGNQATLNELEQKPIVSGAAERLNPELQFPVHDFQLDALNNQDAWNEYRVTHEVPGESGQTLRNYGLAQKKELTHVIDKNIDTLAPNYEATIDPLEAGDRAAQAMTEVIEKNREQLGPAIAEIKNSPLQEVNHLPGVLEYMTDAKNPHGNPQIAKMFDTTGDTVEIKPYSTAMGIDHSAYTAIKQAVNALEENPKDFQSLFNIREGLSQHVDVTKLGKAASQIGNAKAAMMDYIQDLVQKGSPDLKVRDIFKRYAQNEELANNIEKKIGAQIGEENFRSLAKGKPDEAVLKNIFRNSETVQMVKDMLPPEKFNEILADHLAILRNDATENGVFSSRKFAQNLKKNGVSLDLAMGEKPQYGKIQDALTLLKTYGDIASINPSGTAKTLLGALSKVSPFHPGEAIHAFGELAKERFENLRLSQEINAKLSGDAAQATKLNTIQGMIKKVSSQMNSSVKSLFSSPESQTGMRGAILGGAIHLSGEKFNQIAEKLKSFANAPQSLVDHLTDQTGGLHSAAPRITQSLNQSAMTSVSFLNSKLPQAPSSLLLAPKWEPSPAQKATFARYYQAVNDPLQALDQIKNGSLSTETMEALQAVHPEFLQEMRQKVMESLNKEKAMKLSYPKRQALARFMGQPLDQNMMPMSILANQASMNSAQLSQQGAPKQGRKTNLGGLKQLNFASRSATLDHRAEKE